MASCSRQALLTTYPPHLVGPCPAFEWPLALRLWVPSSNMVFAASPAVQGWPVPIIIILWRTKTKQKYYVFALIIYIYTRQAVLRTA